MSLIRITLGLVLALQPFVVQAVVVHTADFINDADRSHFNGFEAVAAGGRLPPFHSEDGIDVAQIGGEGNDIWTECSLCWDGALDGDRAWYPNGGDFGYTQITLAGGADFADVGFLVSSGFTGSDFPDLFLHYELWDDGVMVQSGELLHGSEAPGVLYLGFSGSGFDEIRVRDSVQSGAALLDANRNALSIDSIEVRASMSVAEPGTLALFGLGLFALGLLGGSRKSTRRHARSALRRVLSRTQVARPQPTRKRKR